MTKKSTPLLLKLMLLAGLAGVSANHLCAQHFEWANVYAPDIGSGTITDHQVDANGDIFITGSFTQTVDFDPSGTAGELTSEGSNDVFLAKQDAAGNLLWVQRIGGTNQVRAQDLTLDQNGDVYIVGDFFFDPVDFDPSGNSAQLTPTGMDAFVAKYDASGNYKWAHKLGSSDSDEGHAIAADQDGNVYVAGSFRGTAYLDPMDSTNLTIAAGFNDFFLAKFDTAGNYVWSHGIGSSSSSEEVTSMAVDANNDLYLAGHFRTGFDFDPSSSTANIAYAGDIDAFVAKFDAAGNYVWAHGIGGPDEDEAHAVAIDETNGHVLVTGDFENTVDFDPGSGNMDLISIGRSDAFIARYTMSGGFKNALQMGGVNSDHGDGIAVDMEGSTYTTGYFDDSADFDSSADTAIMLSDGGRDIFVAKYDSTGIYEWSMKIGGNDNDYASSIAVDGEGNIYNAGWFDDTVDFDPSADSAIVVALTNTNFYLAKYAPDDIGIAEIKKTDSGIFSYLKDGSLWINLKKYPGGGSITLYDMQGRAVAEKRDIRGRETAEFRTGSLPYGIYILSVTSEKNEIIHSGKISVFPNR